MIDPRERFGGLLVLLAGVLGVAAFAPFGWYPVAVLSLAVLFNQWLVDSPGRAFLHGALFGVGFFGAGISWVYVSIHYYGHVPPLVAGLLAAALVVFLSLYPALLGYCLRRYTIASGWRVLVLAFPSGWVLSEWLRGWLFSGFPWLNIGASQIDSPLAGFAPVLGVYGLGLAVAVSAALLLAVMRNQRRVVSLVLLAMLWAGGYLLEGVEWTTPRGRTLSVALVQGNISQENKWAPGNLLHTLSRYRELTFNGSETDTDLVVWPETAIPAFYDQVEDTFLPSLEDELAASATDLLTGIPVLERATWSYYNGVLSFGGGGDRAFYYKQHLVPFGEYLPLRGLLGNSLDALAVPNADFSSGGDGQTLLQAAGYPVGTSICFEVVFGEEIIKALPEAAFLVNVSNDAWFGDSLAPHQHLEMARLRASEAGRPMLRATNTGISAIIDHHGRVVVQSPQFEEAVVSGFLVPRQGATPYVLAGNTPVVILALIGLLLPWRERQSGAA